MRKTISATFKLHFPSGLKLGGGKIALLKLIDETGSIAAAAKLMKMSYRRAWLLVQETNAIYGIDIVEKLKGGKGGGGAALTAQGKALVARYEKLQRQIEKSIAEFEEL